MTGIQTDICVIGAGSAGLSVAAGAAQMGANVVLIERHIRDGVMGGDCLHTGCVPSKALLSAAKHAHLMRAGGPFGIAPHRANVDFRAVRGHVRQVIETIAPVDTVERFRGLGVEVINAAARFTGPREVEADGKRIQAKFFVIATGSSPSIPPIPGLDAVSFFTNETIFENETLPDHLIIIGGGPIGVEMAQAHRRLGADVTLIEGANLLGKDDPELVDVVRKSLISEGVALSEGAMVKEVASAGEGRISVSVKQDSTLAIVECSHLLVAVGRAPGVDGLDLEKAGVKSSPKGIEVDARLRTSNKRIFAIGDVTGGLQFTHVAGYHAGIAIRNMLYRIPAKADHSTIPWVTYTDPELAQVGLTQAQAEKQFGKTRIRVLRWDFKENDRAQTERATAGFIKAIVRENGAILGAGIVGAQAGELIQPWVLAMSAKLKISAFAGMIAPYPTLGEISKRAAGAFYTPFLFGARNKFIVKTLLKLP